jgi:hypothetical protein
MLRVTAGVHVAEIRYVPPRLLAAAYGMSLLTLAGWTILVVAGLQPRLDRLKGAAIYAGTWAGWVALAILVTAVATFATIDFVHLPFRHGAARLTLMLPWNVPTGSEPLVVTGRTGAADVVYVHYLSNRRLQVGFDDWGAGGPVSVPIPYWPGQVVEIDVAYATLFGHHPGETPARFSDPAHSSVIVRWNGRVILDTVSHVYMGSATPDIGVNAVGASSCAERFSGEIRSVIRLGAADLPAK